MVFLQDAATWKVVQEYSHHKNETHIDWNPSNPRQFITGSKDTRILINSVDQKEYVMEFGANKFHFDQRMGVECVKYNPHNQNEFAACLKNNKI